MSHEPNGKTARACNACRKRKVKCNGSEPCQQCSHHGLRCGYSLVSCTSRAASVRGRVLKECRPAQHRSPRRLLSAAQDVSSDEWSVDFFRGLVDSYMASVYPTHPIIARDELMQCIDQMKVDKAAAAFVYAGAAATLHCTDEGEDKMATLRNLVTHAIELMGNALPLDNVSVLKATSCFFIANCLVAIQDANTAFLYLRQGVTMIEIMWSNSQMSTEPRLRRLYWLAYVHERYQCFSEDRRPILRPLSAVGLEDNDVAPEILIGLARVVKLFQLIDETFVRCWLNSSHEEAHFTTEWIEAKCDAFEKDEREANSACLTITQEADLFITRHWLLALLWRMSMARGLLRDLSPEKCFSMLFPLHVSKHLRQMMERIPKEAFQIHGVGIVQKLFELTDTVADVMLHVPSAALEQLEDYLYLQNVLFGFPHLDAIRRRIVSDKSARILRNAGSSPYLVDAAS